MPPLASDEDRYMYDRNGIAIFDRYTGQHIPQQVPASRPSPEAIPRIYATVGPSSQAALPNNLAVEAYPPTGYWMRDQAGRLCYVQPDGRVVQYANGT